MILHPVVACARCGVHRPFQFGDALLWIALPQFLIALLIAALLLRFDPRALVAVGLMLVSFAFFQGST